MPDTLPALTLNTGVRMPALGLGVYRASPEDTVTAVRTALDLGYRLVDTAAAYGNEAEVGQALRESDVDRNDVFVTTKLWIADYGRRAARDAFDTSMAKLGLDTLDLWLLHQPVPSHVDHTLDAWRTAIDLLDEGRVRAIGVSNFDANQIQQLVDATDVVPAVNQVELHPHFTQIELRDAHDRLGIITQAWSPIGGVNRYWDKAADLGDPLTDPTIVELADRHGRTPAQVMLRWQLQLGHCVIPKSVNPDRIAENADLFDFALSPIEVAAIEALDTGVRGGPDPASITPQALGITLDA